MWRYFISFIDKLGRHETVIPHNGHVIVIDQGWFFNPVPYLDDESMFLAGQNQDYADEYQRYSKVTKDDGNEVTYSVLLRPKFMGYSIIVEIFDGGSWHGQKSQLIYSG